jgi:hypothetical protein
MKGIKCIHTFRKISDKEFAVSVCNISVVKTCDGDFLNPGNIYFSKFLWTR